jgi:hypothetical protein
MICFKFATNQRVTFQTDLLSTLLYDPIRRGITLGPEGMHGFNVWHFLKVQYLDYGILMPLTAVQAMARYGNWSLALICGAIWALTAIYSLALPNANPGRYALLMNLAFGFLLSVTAYAVFWVIPGNVFTLAGVGNRVAMASSMGVAAAMVGILGLGSGDLRKITGRVLFSITLATYVASGSWINLVIASFWVSAAETQRAVLTDIKRHFPLIPPNTTFLLDGVCPFLGPAVVFASYWDLWGALQLVYQAGPVRADVITSRSEFSSLGVSTTVYGSTHWYHYSSNLVLYNYKRNFSKVLASYKDAQSYLETKPKMDCGAWEDESIGVPIF